MICRTDSLPAGKKQIRSTVSALCYPPGCFPHRNHNRISFTSKILTPVPCFHIDKRFVIPFPITTFYFSAAKGCIIAPGGGVVMGMPGIWEILIIVLILIVIFGGNRSMSIIRDLGKEVFDLKKKLKDLDDIRK